MNEVYLDEDSGNYIISTILNETLALAFTSNMVDYYKEVNSCGANFEITIEDWIKNKMDCDLISKLGQYHQVTVEISPEAWSLLCLKFA